MIFRNLNANHDWTFGSGLGNYISGNSAIGLNIETRILSWLNDCFFDLNAGIDWLNRLGNKNQKNLLDLDLKRIILQSYGVTALVSFSSELNGRIYMSSYTVNTIFSQGYQRSLNQNLSNIG